MKVLETSVAGFLFDQDMSTAGPGSALEGRRARGRRRLGDTARGAATRVTIQDRLARGRRAGNDARRAVLVSAAVTRRADDRSLDALILTRPESRSGFSLVWADGISGDVSGIRYRH